MVKLRPYQIDLIDKARRSMQAGNRKVLVQLPTGGGKCLGFGTPVIMFDGSVKAVQDVQVGDLLMGDDSTPRRVLSLARGREMMYSVTSGWRETFTCNESHILSLVDNDTKSKTWNQVIDISVSDYLKLSKSRKHCLKQFAVGVDWSTHDSLSIDPYFLGLWLGDGTSAGTQLTTMDAEVVDFVTDYANEFGLSVRKREQPGNKSSVYSVTSGTRRANPLLDLMREADLIGNKHIPREYLIASRENRLLLLAGIVDSDGFVHNNSLEITQRREELTDQIIFLARSLGLRAVKAIKIVNGERYYRLGISGDLSCIPTRVPRRAFRVRKAGWKDALRSAFDIQELGVGDYYGFEIDGNGRFLLGDFTVTHNTAIASEILKLITERGNKAIFVADRRKLIDQTSEKLRDYGVDHGVIMAGRQPDWDAPVQVASIQTVASRAIRNSWMELPDAQLLCFDEAHKSLGPSYFKLIDEFYPNAFLLGLTATPVRADGRGLGEMYDDLIIGPNIDTLVDDGFLVPMRYFAPSQPDMEYLDKIYDSRKGDYNETKLGEYMENNKPLIGDIVQNYQRIAGDRQAVVFASSVRHSIYLAEAFNRAGIPAEHIDGTTYHLERQRIYDDVHSGKTRVLTNCAVLIEGWDEPQISCVILARPTKSVSTYLQMAGRVLRPYPGKVDSILIDHSGAVRELGFVNDERAWSLDPTKPIDAREDRLSTQDDDAPQKDENIICEECFTVYKGRRKCPNCGWEPPKKAPKPTKVLEAELEEVRRAEFDKAHKLDWFERALGLEKIRRLPSGWAQRAYRLKFKTNEFPKPRKVGIPDKEIENWLKHMEIRERYSKSPRRVRNG